MISVRQVTSLIIVASAVCVLTSLPAARQNATTITLWHSVPDGDPFRPVLDGAIQAFDASQPQLVIEAQAIPGGDFAARLQAAVDAGQPPDVFSTEGGETLAEQVRTGIVREIPQLNSAAEETFVASALRSSTFNGKHYAIPATVEGVFLWYNRGLFEQYGVPVPATWGQLLSACQTFRQAGIVPVALGNRDAWSGSFWYNYLVLRIGGAGAFDNALNGYERQPFATQPFVEAAGRIQDAVGAGCFEDNLNATDVGSAQQMFTAAAAPMMLQSNRNLFGLNALNWSMTQDYARTTLFPVVEGRPGSSAEMVGETGYAFAVSAGAPPETASILLQLFGVEAFGRGVAQAGLIPALAGGEAYIADPLLRDMAHSLAGAETLQPYYNEALPPDLSRTHLDAMQQLFAFSISPQAMADAMRRAAQEYRLAKAEQVGTLAALGWAHGLLIGTAAQIEPIQDDPAYSDILRREFSLMTPEVAMKMEPLHPTPDSYDFTEPDELMRFAEANDLRVRGHTLVWHMQLPAWVENGGFTREELLGVMRDHIFALAGRYRGRIAVWDVVNEAFELDGAYRDTVWQRVIGPDYIDYAFRWAHEADPNALLFYNDAYIEGLGAQSDAVYELMQSLIERGVPVHGVGFQMHIGTADPPNLDEVAANIDRLAALGLQVQITELDVQIGADHSAERLAAQAQLYGDIARLCLSKDACTALAMWGFTDNYTWIPALTGIADAPLIFDTNYQPKPAYYALRDALLQAGS